MVFVSQPTSCLSLPPRLVVPVISIPGTTPSPVSRPPQPAASAPLPGNTVSVSKPASIPQTTPSSSNSSSPRLSTKPKRRKRGFFSNLFFCCTCGSSVQLDDDERPIPPSVQIIQPPIEQITSPRAQQQQESFTGKNLEARRGEGGETEPETPVITVNGVAVADAAHTPLVRFYPSRDKREVC